MYKVKVQGTYIARSPLSDKERIIRSYEVDGVIPTAVAALSIVKNKLLGPALSKKYTDYITFRTYNIIELTPMDEKSKAELAKIEIAYMDRPTLLKLIKDEALVVKPEYYPDLFKLREAVKFAKEDPVGYEKHFALHEQELRLDIEMARLNPTLFANVGDAPDVIGKADFANKKAKASSADDLDIKTENRLTGLKSDLIRDGELANEEPDL